ncbi:hypothetical protein [Bacillus suaedaesalsae]|uniref:YfhD family protein n=1 Tax=Bacillus suaedaesalsae TaxID=2810349 RepID=A0ABS2DI14_9BACI|nr:hypothetical protein [Bacillus suaedaesalsae]MBM6617655.1 hypothetical protein [Bacillus suaedaesalsae]
MKKWNEQAAPNNNLSSADIENSNLPNEHEFSEELSDGMERNEAIEKTQTNNK